MSQFTWIFLNVIANNMHNDQNQNWECTFGLLPMYFQYGFFNDVNKQTLHGLCRSAGLSTSGLPSFWFVVTVGQHVSACKMTKSSCRAVYDLR